MSGSYGIAQAERSTVKKISGKIIPAISTTTAFVTGAVAVELYKLTAGMTAIESFRSCFANLSMPMLCFTEPGACQKFTAGKKTFTEWDHVTLRKVGTAGRCEVGGWEDVPRTGGVSATRIRSELGRGVLREFPSV